MTTTAPRHNERRPSDDQHADPSAAKIVWIRNTLDLRDVECSAAYLEEARGRGDLEILTEPRAWPFDAEGNLPLDGVRAMGK